MFPSNKAQARARAKVREFTGPKRCFVPLPSLIEDLNRWLRSWSNYFRHGYPRTAFRRLNWFVQERLIRHLQRRSQRPYRPPAGTTFYAHLQTLGLRPL